MKRNVYLILITVITILCIIAGTGYHLVRFGLSVAEGLPFFSEFIEAISDWDDDDDDLIGELLNKFVSRGQPGSVFYFALLSFRFCICNIMRHRI